MQKKAALISAIASALLTGCGGGGDSDTAQQASNTPAPAPASSPTPSPTPASSPSPSPDPASSPSPTPVGEALPNLADPQLGSTAATGTGPVGVWSANSGLGRALAFIDPSLNIYSLNSSASFVTSELIGSISTLGASWSMVSGKQFSLVSAYPVNSGSGTYVQGQTFSGTYLANGMTQSILWGYDVANALSVTQNSVTGTWSQTSVSLTIDSAGALTGTLSGCDVSGTLHLATPGTNQNLYNMSISAAAGTSCPMPAGMVYSGLAAIVFVPVSGSNAYQRTIAYLVQGADGQHVAYGQPTKQ